MFKLKDCPVTQGLPSAKEEFHPALQGAGGGSEGGRSNWVRLPSTAKERVIGREDQTSLLHLFP